MPLSSEPRIRPRIIIHGGAGNITRANLPPESYKAYRAALLNILHDCSELLQKRGATALDVAVHAVSMLEDNPLFNAGKGAVFTRAGTIELESSVMVSNGLHKRGVGCMLLKHVKNPIKLAKEVLVRGEDIKGGGAQTHCQLSGEYLEDLAKEWGLEMCESTYFYTRKRWEEHKKGLEREKKDPAKDKKGKQHALHDSGYGLPEIVPPESDSNDPSWDGKEYLPQGTVGAVVLDSFGTTCVATSTGGLTNKVPGRIGDTPTLGAGFWAEEWFEELSRPNTMLYESAACHDEIPQRSLRPSIISSCFGFFSLDEPLTQSGHRSNEKLLPATPLSKHIIRHAVAMSGTGNGDSFLRINAVRTAAAMSRFSSPNLPLASCVTRVAGPYGELQKSAGDRWGVTGEGEGGIIGIELVGEEGKVVFDQSCKGMFRAWVDDKGEERFMVFRDKEY